MQVSNGNLKQCIGKKLVMASEKEQQVSIVQCTMQQRISSQEKAIAELNQRLSSCQVRNA